MKSTGGLFSVIVSAENLHAAMIRAARGKTHRPAVQRFLADAGDELGRLRDELGSGSYRPRPYLQFRIMDPKPRLISCADFRDRVVHHAVCAVVSPIFERRFIDDSFACRVGKGTHRAVLRAWQLTRRFPYYWKADVASYFDSIDHTILLEMTDRLFREKALRELLRRIVEAPLPGQAPGKGLPVGNLTSQWFANLYLDRLDHFVKETCRASGYIRYMDDFVVWGGSEGSLFGLWAEVRAFLAESLSLRLKAPGSRVAPCGEGVPFLGWRVFHGTLRLQGSRRRRSARLVHTREREYARGEITDVKLAQCVGSSVGLTRFFGLRGLWPSTVEA